MSYYDSLVLSTRGVDMDQIASMTATVDAPGVTAHVGEGTGNVLITASSHARGGTTSVTVTYTLKDGRVVTDTAGFMVKYRTLDTVFDASWDMPGSAASGERVVSKYPVFTDITGRGTYPTDVSYSVSVASESGVPVPSGWVSVDSYGAISARPGWDIASGKYLIRASATFADGTEVSEVIPLTVTRGSDAERFSPSVVGEVFLSNDPEDVVRTAVAVASGSESLPESATFGFSTSEGLSEVDSYGVGQINPSTGELKFTPRADMKAGTYTSVVRVSYADGSFDDVTVVFHVGGSFMSSLYSPVVPALEVARRGSAVSKVPRNAVASTPLPEQMVFKPGRFMPEWASLADDGSVTVRPDLNVRPGTYTLYALAQYPDSSVDEVAYTVKVLSLIHI